MKALYCKESPEFLSYINIHDLTAVNFHELPEIPKQDAGSVRTRMSKHSPGSKKTNLFAE